MPRTIVYRLQPLPFFAINGAIVTQKQDESWIVLTRTGTTEVVTDFRDGQGCWRVEFPHDRPLGEIERNRTADAARTGLEEYFQSSRVQETVDANV